MRSFLPLVAAFGLAIALLGLSLIFPLDRSYHIERKIYRHHRISGLLLTFAAGLWFWLISPGEIVRHSIAAIHAYVSHLLARGELLTLIQASVACTIFAIGILITFRPSLLKPVEAYLNREKALRSRKPPFSLATWSKKLSLTWQRFLGISMIASGALLFTGAIRWLIK